MNGRVQSGDEIPKGFPEIAELRGRGTRGVLKIVYCGENLTVGFFPRDLDGTFWGMDGTGGRGDGSARDGRVNFVCFATGGRWDESEDISGCVPSRDGTPSVAETTASAAVFLAVMGFPPSC